MNICFTGPAVVNGERIARELLMDLAGEAGMYVQKAVNAATAYVVASSEDFKGRKGTKLRKVDELNSKGCWIKVISPEQFMNMVSNSRQKKIA